MKLVRLNESYDFGFDVPDSLGSWRRDDYVRHKKDNDIYYKNQWDRWRGSPRDYEEYEPKMVFTVNSEDNGVYEIEVFVSAGTEGAWGKVSTDDPVGFMKEVHKATHSASETAASMAYDLDHSDYEDDEDEYGYGYDDAVESEYESYTNQVERDLDKVVKKYK